MTHDFSKIGYWPSSRREVAKIRLLPKAIGSFSTSKLNQVTLNALLELAQQTTGAPEPLHKKVLEAEIYVEDLVPVLFKHLCQHKKLPDDVALDEILVIQPRHPSQAVVEKNIIDYLFSKSGPYYFAMIYLKNLDRLGYLERLSDAGTVITDKKQTRNKETLKEKLAQTLTEKE